MRGIHIFLSLVVVGSILSALFVITGTSHAISKLAIPKQQYGLLSAPYVDGKILFLPDSMLGRAIEILIETKGDTLAQHVIEITDGYDAVIGNFEGAVPERHTPTKNDSLIFSVQREHMKFLRNTGFTTLSLANNHSFDFGEAGYNNTIKVCAELLLTCAGNPEEVTSTSVAYVTSGDARIAILMLNDVDKSLSMETLVTTVHDTRLQSDIQIVFIHWGEEYSTGHTTRQEAIAKSLIDQGVDAVIGHHPHVVADIDIYKEKPIFYSLGNFIFDQYFDKAVQEGYGVSLTIEKDFITYTLIPYETYTKKSHPTVLTGTAYDAFMENILNRSAISAEQLRVPREEEVR